MAAVDVKGVNYTKNETFSTSSPIARGEKNASVKVCIDTYTTDATEDAGSTITMGAFPDNAILLGLTVAHTGLGTNVTLAAGDGTDADEYFAATAAATVGSIVADLDLNTAVVSGAIVLTTAGATLDTGNTITMIAQYVEKLA